MNDLQHTVASQDTVASQGRVTSQVFPVTQRLYYEDAYQQECRSTVTHVGMLDRRPAILLDRSIFYPTSGGQPNDTGTLNGQSVIDVVVGEQGEVWHVFAEGALLPTIGDELVGQIDWQRRFDHMQQHAGQHLISQVFVRHFGYETLAVHFGSEENTLDLAVESIDSIKLEDAERICNQIAYSALPIKAYFVTEADLSQIQLRRPPKVTGSIRIVEIEQFDWSACGGTHTRSTAEIAPIKFIKQERRRGQTRLTFLCGKRAVVDYTQKHQWLMAIASRFSTDTSQVLPLVERALAHNKELQQRVDELSRQLLSYSAAALLQAAKTINGVNVVRHIEIQADANALKLLAGLITAAPSSVVLLACPNGDKTTLVFARSGELQFHMGNLLRTAVQQFGGNGGGKADFAQGGGVDWQQANALLDFAFAQIVGAS